MYLPGLSKIHVRFSAALIVQNVDTTNHKLPFMSVTIKPRAGTAFRIPCYQYQHVARWWQQQLLITWVCSHCVFERAPVLCDTWLYTAMTSTGLMRDWITRECGSNQAWYIRENKCTNYHKAVEEFHCLLLKPKSTFWSCGCLQICL